MNNNNEHKAINLIYNLFKCSKHLFGFVIHLNTYKIIIKIVKTVMQYMERLKVPLGNIYLALAIYSESPKIILTLNFK